nr:HlyD family type I secretion periplasmic adaptor subunit [Rhizobium sp. CFBP 8762]
MLLLMICGFFTLAIAWSIIGKVDVVAVASGKIIPSGKVKTVQPMEIGSIRAIHVENGQHVKEGQILVEIDPTLAAADEEQARKTLFAATLLKARNAAILAYMDGRALVLSVPEDIPAAMVATEKRFVWASIAEYEAKRTSLRKQIAQQVAGLASTSVEIHKLRQTLPLVRDQFESRQVLTGQGHYARLRLLENEQLLIEHTQNINVRMAEETKGRAAIETLEADMQALRETFTRTAVEGLSEATEKEQIASEELRKTTRRLEMLQLRAPVSGTVQQLAVATIGGVVQPAQPLMTIVPDGTELEVEAQVLNKDIGFIREGQHVRVKLEAFPFTDYGLVPGIVSSISRDAIDLSQSDAPQQDEKGRPVRPGLVYAARIRLQSTSINIGVTKVPLSPGLSVQAEIKTGERRIIRYLLSPISQAFDEAGRER